MVLHCFYGKPPGTTVFRAPQVGDGFMGHLTRLLDIHCILSIALAHVQLQALSCKTEISFVCFPRVAWLTNSGEIFLCQCLFCSGALHGLIA